MREVILARLSHASPRTSAPRAALTSTPLPRMTTPTSLEQRLRYLRNWELANVALVPFMVALMWRSTGQPATAWHLRWIGLTFVSYVLLRAAAGLYGAISLGLLSTLFGGTYVQISGPTGPMTVVATAAVASCVTLAGSLEAAAGAIVATFLLQVGMGVSRLATRIRLTPYPVITGFRRGIGVIITLHQLFPAIGQPSPPTTLDVVTRIGPALTALNVWAVGGARARRTATVDRSRRTI